MVPVVFCDRNFIQISSVLSVPSCSKQNRRKVGFTESGRGRQGITTEHTEGEEMERNPRGRFLCVLGALRDENFLPKISDNRPPLPLRTPVQTNRQTVDFTGARRGSRGSAVLRLLRSLRLRL